LLLLRPPPTYTPFPYTTLFRSSREGRAISGVSMGGYGALTIGLRHPSMFCSIGAQSGALDFARSARAKLEAGDPPQRNVAPPPQDRKSTRLNSSHVKISYAVFC